MWTSALNHLEFGHHANKCNSSIWPCTRELNKGVPAHLLRKAGSAESGKNQQRPLEEEESLLTESQEEGGGGSRHMWGRERSHRVRGATRVTGLEHMYYKMVPRPKQTPECSHPTRISRLA